MEIQKQVVVAILSSLRRATHFRPSSLCSHRLCRNTPAQWAYFPVACRAREDRDRCIFLHIIHQCLEVYRLQCFKPLTIIIMIFIHAACSMRDDEAPRPNLEQVSSRATRSRASEQQMRKNNSLGRLSSALLLLPTTSIRSPAGGVGLFQDSRLAQRIFKAAKSWAFGHSSSSCCRGCWLICTQVLSGLFCLCLCWAVVWIPENWVPHSIRMS